MRPSKNLKNKIPSDTYWRVQLVFMKIKAHSSIEPILKYDQDQMPLANQGSLWNFNQPGSWGVWEIICSFRLVLEEKAGNDIQLSQAVIKIRVPRKIFKKQSCFQMQKTTPPGHWIEKVKQIYLCWEYYFENTISNS